MGLSRQEYWSGLPFPSPGDLSDPGIKPVSFMSPALPGRFFKTAKSLQSCLTLCDPMDCSLPAFSVHGILQARILEQVAISSSRGSPDPGIKTVSLVSPALVAKFFTLDVILSMSFVSGE